MNDIPLRPFVWRDIKGNTWTIKTIHTGHAYSLMKMLWNECAKTFPELLQIEKTNSGLRTHLPNTIKALRIIQLFLELETRGAPDCLPLRFQKGYERLRAEITRFGNGIKMLQSIEEGARGEER